MKKLHTLVLALASSFAVAPSMAAEPSPRRPTVVLVHGAFAEAASWDGVIHHLLERGIPVVAADNPLRGVASDADHVGRLVAAQPGPVVLVGHSYGGAVISNVRAPNVRALVFVAAFAPQEGESALALSGRFPGSTLGAALAAPVVQADGGKDLSIRQDRFPEQFAADVPLPQACRMAVSQRPIAEAALVEPSGPPAWTSIPSWFIHGTADRTIPPAAMAWMAERAKSRKTVEVRGASHVVLISNAKAVADLIEKAVRSVPAP